MPLTSSASFVVPEQLVGGFFLLWILPHTRIFNDKLDIEDGNNLALTLADIDVSVHADQLVHFRGDTIFFSLDVLDAILEVLLGPRRSIFIDPVPVIGVVKNHLGQMMCEIRKVGSKLFYLRAMSAQVSDEIKDCEENERKIRRRPKS